MTITMGQIQESVRRGRSREAQALVKQALEEGAEAREIVSKGMIPAMRVDKNMLAAEDVDIASLLASARTMQKCLQLMEPVLHAEGEERYIGTAIIGTIEGDLHEVGKNLVCIMFQSVGFRVFDLGVDITGKQYLQAIREHPEADIVCISSLLSTSEQSMRKVVRMLKKEQKTYRYTIMVGGGSVTEEFARSIGADIFTENAADAAHAAMQLVKEKNKVSSDERKDDLA